MANRLQLESRQERYFGELGRVAASLEPARSSLSRFLNMPELS